MKNTKEKTIDDYIAVEIWYRFFGWCVYLIIFFVFLYLTFNVDLRIGFIAFIIFLWIIFLTTYNIIIIYHKKKIKKYILSQNLINKIGKILYWYNHEQGANSDHDFLLTENYIIVLCKRKITHFKYEDIVSIKMKESYQHTTNYLNQKNELYVTLIDGRIITMVVYDGVSVARFKDVSTILLEKNKKIKVEGTDIETWYKAYFRW